MKSQRRHELQTNELADAIGHFLGRFKGHTNAILYAIAAVALAIALVLVLRPGPSTVGAELYAAIRSPDTQAMQAFIENHPNKEVTNAVRMALADRLLTEAVVGVDLQQNVLSSERIASNVAEARSLYQQLAGSSDETIKTLAEQKLALVELQEGSLDKGREGLKRIVQQYPNSLAAAAAASHLAMLQDYTPMEFAPEAPKPEEAKPEEAKPEEAKPEEAKPEEAKPTPPAVQPAPTPEAPPAEKPADDDEPKG